MPNEKQNSNLTADIHHETNDETPTKLASLGAAATFIGNTVIQNSPELKNIILNPKLRVKVVDNILKDPEIAKVVHDVSNNKEFIENLSNISTDLLNQFSKTGFHIYKRYKIKKIWDKLFGDEDSFFGENWEELESTFSESIVSLETVFSNIFEMESSFTANLIETGSEAIGEGVEFIGEAGEVTSEFIEPALEIISALLEWL